MPLLPVCLTTAFVRGWNAFFKRTGEKSTAGGDETAVVRRAASMNALRLEVVIALPPALVIVGNALVLADDATGSNPRFESRCMVMQTIEGLLDTLAAAEATPTPPTHTRSILLPSLADAHFFKENSTLSFSIPTSQPETS